MPTKQFPVSDDLVTLVWQLAKPAPFENLSFDEALRRVLITNPAQQQTLRRQQTAEEMLDELMNLSDEEFSAKYPRIEKPRLRQRAASPSPKAWLKQVPELAKVANLTTWRAICDHLKVDVGADSARRRLEEWVTENRPTWPAVPVPVAD